MPKTDFCEQFRNCMFKTITKRIKNTETSRSQPTAGGTQTRVLKYWYTQSPPHLRNVFCLFIVVFRMFDLHCAEFDSRSFHIYLQKTESFSVFSVNVRAGFSDIISSLEVNQSGNTLRMDFSVT